MVDLACASTFLIKKVGDARRIISYAQKWRTDKVFGNDIKLNATMCPDDPASQVTVAEA